MSTFEKGLSRVILDQTVALTADQLFYATSASTRVNVRTAIEDLILRVTALEQAGSAGSVDKYIFLDGNSEITFSSGADDLLDWSKSWSLGLDIVEVDPTWAADNMKMCIFSSGGSFLTLNRAGPAPAQMGSYNTSKSDLYHTTARANANTWYPLTADSRIMYVYDHVAKKLSYYLGDRSTGAYGRRAHITIPQTMIDEQVNGGNLTISGNFVGPGGGTFNGVRLLNTGVDQMIATTTALDDTQVAEYMDSSDHYTLSFSLFAFACLGEEAYPTVTDKLNNLHGGTFSGGSASDFKILTP